MANDLLPLGPDGGGGGGGEDAGAERAFNTLSAQVVVMRQAVETLTDTVADAPSVDYSLTLGELAKAQIEIAADVAKVARHTAANLPDGFFRAEVQRGVAAGLSMPAKLLIDAREALIQITDRVKAEERAAEEARRQWWWVFVAGGFIAGLFAMFAIVELLMPSFPDSWGEGIAAHAIGKSPAQAGAQLIGHADPDQWRAIVEGHAIREAGGKLLLDCYLKAEKAGKPVRCVVTMVPVAK